MCDIDLKCVGITNKKMIYNLPHAILDMFPLATLPLATWQRRHIEVSDSRGGQRKRVGEFV